MPLPTFAPIRAPICTSSRGKTIRLVHGKSGRFGVLAAFSLALACAFAMAGVWMVLPYAILELALVGLAFRLVERRAGDWERLVVIGDTLLADERVAVARKLRRLITARR